MSKLPEVPPVEDAEHSEQTARRLTTAICRNVITALGRPKDLLRITARQVTSDGFRVNVLTGVDVASGRISHSFFVKADEQGKVTDSAPAILKQY
jgi:hypothetical protein